MVPFASNQIHWSIELDLSIVCPYDTDTPWRTTCTQTSLAKQQNTATTKNTFLDFETACANLHENELKKKKKRSVGRKIIIDVIQTCHKMACHLQRKQKLIYSEIIFGIKCTIAFLCLFREYWKYVGEKCLMLLFMQTLIEAN